MKLLISAVMLLSIITLQAKAENISGKLQKSFIYSRDKGNAVVFRKNLILEKKEIKGSLYVFADSYYALYINGKYILSGPSRFDPKKPEYDSIDISGILRKGRNSIAVLVYGGISNGMRMKHEPGLTLAVSGNGFELLTDTSWKCSPRTRFIDPYSRWNGIKETIDASKENGDCLSAGYDDSNWKRAVFVDGGKWGSLKPRILPLLAERNIKPKTGFAFPFTSKGLSVLFDKNYLLNVEMEFEARKGTEIKIDDFKYTAREGRQYFRMFDAFGITDAKMKIEISDSIKIFNIKFINRIYPFEPRGTFECSDPRLTKLWQVSIHTLQQCTEDGYQDCPWERAEWMGDAAVVEFPLHQTALGTERGLISDKRLMKKMLNDIALSQDSAGRMKAHHPSDRFDIHAYIEDYTCLWIECLRNYYESTGDRKFLKEMYPYMKRQADWFIKQIGGNGIVKGREFFIFGNPLLYKVCEGATLNANIFRAFIDASKIAGAMKDTKNESLYIQTAMRIKESFNRLLWNNEEKTYNGSTEFKPTHLAAMVSLDRGIVPPDRISFVRKWFLDRYEEASKSFFTYAHFGLMKLLFEIESNEWDTNALNIIRQRYASNYSDDNAGFTTGESFSMDRPFHNFGSSASYFFHSKILGVTVDAPLEKNIITIKPRYGDLTYARGTVLTEQGPVDVDWKRNKEGWSFMIKVPAGKKARVYLPLDAGKPVLRVNSAVKRLLRDENYILFELREGLHKGKLEFNY